MFEVEYDTYKGRFVGLTRIPIIKKIQLYEIIAANDWMNLTVLNHLVDVGSKKWLKLWRLSKSIALTV